MDYLPFSTAASARTTNSGFDLLRPLLFFLDSSERVYWEYLLFALILSIPTLVWWKLKEARASGRYKPGEQVDLLQIMKECLPKAVYFHRSALVDYMYFVVNIAAYPLLVPATYFASAKISLLAQSGIRQIVGDAQFVSQAAHGDNLRMGLLYTFAVVVVTDFTAFITHYLQHRIPILWEFHKVHHSARVMTPITVYRMHPVDDILAIGTASVFVGTMDAIFRYFCPQISGQMTVANLNIFVYLFYFFGYNLRHSHIWLSYGQYISKYLISPAQHQIHHSDNPRHFDKNFGFMFAFWDRFFGTLYVPRGKEEIAFGLGGEESDYKSIVHLYLLPFKKAAGRILRREW